MAPAAGQLARRVDDEEAAIEGRALQAERERLALDEGETLDRRVQEAGDSDHGGSMRCRVRLRQWRVPCRSHPHDR